MTRFATRTSLLAAALLAVTFGASADDPKKDEEKEPASISEIMKKSHAGPKSYVKVLTAGVKNGDWDDLKKPAKAYKKLAMDLGKNDPPKGEKESWEKLTKELEENVTEVEKGVKEKDAKLTTAALAKIGKSCKTCHTEHKE